MQCIAIANHKGGVGKTALTQNIGALLADDGRRVLLVDLDPQASLTSAWQLPEFDASMASVMGGHEPGRVVLPEIIHKVRKRLDLAPADISLAVSEAGLFGRIGREFVLKRALSAVAADYDVCLVDCPPSLGSLTINALAAADGVLAPTQTQATDLKGLRLFLDTIGRMQEGLGHQVVIIGVIPTFYDARYIHHQDAIDAMQRGGLPLMPAIGRTVKIAEAMAAGMPLHDYEPGNPQVDNLKQVTRKVDQWLRRSPT